MRKIAVILMVLMMITAAACASGSTSENPWEPSFGITPPEKTPRIKPTVTPFVIPSNTPIDVPYYPDDPLGPAHTPISEHFFFRAWDEFLHSYNIGEVQNELYMFADLDGDGEDEMIAYRENLSEHQYSSEPHMTIYDYENGNEISVPVPLNIGFYYYAKIYLSALNQIIVEDNATEGYFYYDIYSYKNGTITVITEERNGLEDDIAEWEVANALVRPWADENPDYPFRYIGLGMLYYESYDPDSGDASIVDRLASDSAKMAAYQQP